MRLRSPSGELEAVYRPEAGMACVSLRHRGAELLGRDGTAPDRVLREAMVGMPVLHPWANRLSAERYTFAGREGYVPRDLPIVPRDGNGIPLHGLVPPPDAWRAEIASDATALRATLDFPGGDAVRERAFPFPHRVTLDVMAEDAGLRVDVEVRPTGDVVVPVAVGFHPYFHPPAGERSAWTVGLPPMRRVETDARGLPTGATTAVAARTFALDATALDDGFVDVAPGATFSVDDGERVIAVRFDAGFPVAQVYAPTNDDVVCLEPMTAPADALVRGAGLPQVAPGETYTARFTVLIDSKER